MGHYKRKWVVSVILFVFSGEGSLQGFLDDMNGERDGEREVVQMTEELKKKGAFLDDPIHHKGTHVMYCHSWNSTIFLFVLQFFIQIRC